MVSTNPWGFRRVPARDWYVPGEDLLLLWVFRLELQLRSSRLKPFVTSS